MGVAVARELALGVLQMVLRLLSLVPAIGIVADGLDIGISYARGDWWGVILGCGAFIPAAGIPIGIAAIVGRKFPRILSILAKIGAKSRKLLKALQEALEFLAQRCPSPVKKWLDDLIEKIDDLIRRLDAPKGSRADFHVKVRAEGFELHGTTSGGYVQYRHPDGRRIYIRPNGEVIRTGPKITPSGGGKGYRPRIDIDGNPIDTHNPGEFLNPLPECRG